MKKILFIFTFFISNFVFSIPAFAQSVKTTPGCPHNFTRDLQYDSTGNDVYVLQQILNSDKRTTIASSGVGSPGMESNYFGKGTREALKHFQALFIEYIGIADGKFTGRTREMLQSICNGKSLNPEVKTNNQNTSQAETQTTKLKTPLQIKLSLDTKSVPANSSFKVFLVSNKEVKPVTPDIFIVDGGTVSEVRKLSKTEYFAMVTPEDGAKTINVQIEADKVEDIEGMRNENASNEITLTANNSATTTKSSILGGAVDSLQSNFDKILSGITASLPMSNPSQATFQTPIYTPTQRSPVPSAPSSSGTSGGSGSGLSQMLSGLLGGVSRQQQQEAIRKAQLNNETNEGVSAQTYSPGDNTFTGGSVDLSSLNVPDFCKAAPGYGGKQAGKCFDMESTTPEVKEATALACAAINKLIPITSASRNGRKCQNGGVDNSQHKVGKALDIWLPDLSKTERQKIFEVYWKKGFHGYGCYGENYFTHVDHGPARHWKNGACPEELFLGGYPRI